VSLGFWGGKTFSLPVLQVGRPFPIPRDTHQAQHFRSTSLSSRSLTVWLATRAAQLLKSGNSDISSLSIQPVLLDRRRPERFNDSSQG
jgi:hypothetical protein